MSHPVRTTISVHHFVDELMAGLLPLAVSRRNLVINQIDRELEIGADENMLAYILWNLLDKAVSSTRSECIHIESVNTVEGTMIRVRNAGVYFYRAFSNSYRQVQQAAERLGGNITIDYSNYTSTTIEFTLQTERNAA